MQVGDIVKYYGCIGIITEIVDAVRFPNNTPCKKACVFFGSGHKQMINTELKQLEVI